MLKRLLIMAAIALASLTMWLYLVGTVHAGISNGNLFYVNGTTVYPIDPTWTLGGLSAPIPGLMATNVTSTNLIFTNATGSRLLLGQPNTFVPAQFYTRWLDTKTTPGIDGLNAILETDMVHATGSTTAAQINNIQYILTDQYGGDNVNHTGTISDMAGITLLNQPNSQWEYVRDIDGGVFQSGGIVNGNTMGLRGQNSLFGGTSTQAIATQAELYAVDGHLLDGRALNAYVEVDGGKQDSVAGLYVPAYAGTGSANLKKAYGGYFEAPGMGQYERTIYSASGSNAFIGPTMFGSSAAPAATVDVAGGFHALYHNTGTPTQDVAAFDIDMRAQASASNVYDNIGARYFVSTDASTTAAEIGQMTGIQGVVYHAATGTKVDSIIGGTWGADAAGPAGSVLGFNNVAGTLPTGSADTLTGFRNLITLLGKATTTIGYYSPAWTATVAPQTATQMYLEGPGIGTTQWTLYAKNGNNAFGGKSNFGGLGSPSSTITVTDGDVEVTSSTRGIILHSPSGACYRTTVSDAGALQTALISCP